MINILILIINSLYLITGIMEFWLAPKVGPNPYFGFKIGYTFADREVWNRTNRLMGKFIMMHSAILFPTALVSNFLLPYTLLLTIPLIAFIPFGIRYASILLEMKGAKSESVSYKKIESINLGYSWSLSPLIFYLALILFEIITYSSLPEIVAVHFDSYGNPNGWSTKSSFIITYSLFSLISPGISYLFIYLGKKHPMYIHPGKMRFSRDAILKTTILSMNIMSIIIIFVYYSIYVYAVEKIVVPWWWFIAGTLFLIFLPMGYIIHKWKEKKGGD